MTASSQFLSSLFGLDDQVAVVIGGTGVLGGALCDGLAQAGARVVVVVSATVVVGAGTVEPGLVELVERVSATDVAVVDVDDDELA